MLRPYVTQAHWHEESLKELALDELTYLYSEHTLIEELYKRGFCGTTLWHVNDVQNILKFMNEEMGTQYSLSRDECMEILEYALREYSDSDFYNEIVKYHIRQTLGIKEDDA